MYKGTSVQFIKNIKKYLNNSYIITDTNNNIYGRKMIQKNIIQR